ncbi:cysteine-rich receptor-like protein kinase 43 [Cryptomeria japonica]|uniref:cysteine-rich receptor-like protein kinase 43 n=1 Tax=Cryptomeria japonica TaxID=3369 RepID=UPI0027DA5915|nr:cysteine-rich receptor-like protein kinase 43 [Cryptomeria japonica]
MQIAYRAKYPVSVCAVLFLSIVCNAQLTFNDVHLYICSTKNYTSTKLESNLNSVLNNLVSNTSSSSNGFNTSVYGRTPDKVYGLLQCWGDATVAECFNCSNLARTSVRQECRNAIGARAWLPRCFIRYDNYDFIGILDTEMKLAYNGKKVTVDPDGFSTAVWGFLTKLSIEAVGSPRRYSSGSITTSTFQQIYGLVQCWSDLTSVRDCKTCLKNAIGELLNVTGDGTHIGGEVAFGSCVARYDTYTFFDPASAPSQPPFQLLSPPSPLKPKFFSNKIDIVLGTLGGFLVMLLLCLFAVRRKFKSAVLWKPPFLRKENPDTDVFSAIGEEHVMMFKLENIKAATRDFHDDNKLGEGGFGSVYKGTMLDGKQIAVKKLSLKSLQGKNEFLNEVKLVAKIQHRNLGKLLGCCTEQLERLLVYEFLVNKSLDKILFHPERRKELDWPKRLNIICGIARGLLYLHEDSHLRIIHRDIKASNILLDEKMEPKISDFGLARLIGQDESHVETRVAGTYGYMAPEYAMQGQLSTKADVYSFGVVILEIIFGRKNTDKRLFPEFQSLIDWVWRSYHEGNIVNVIDREIVEFFSNEQVSRCIYVGLLCSQANASLRPPMTTIYAMLSNPSMEKLLDPTNPAYLSLEQNAIPRRSYTSKSMSITTSTTPSTSSTSHLLPPSIINSSITSLDPR